MTSKRQRILLHPAAAQSRSNLLHQTASTQSSLNLLHPTASQSCFIPTDLRSASTSKRSELSLLDASENDSDEDFEAAKLKEFGQEMGGAVEASASGRKPRMAWTNKLNNKFLKAFRALGHKASPKDITEYMGVPGLSRRLVASHLRDFLRSERDAINRDISILESGGLLGLQYLSPSIRQYQEASARISAAFNLNLSSNLNTGSGSSSSSSPVGPTDVLQQQQNEEQFVNPPMFGGYGSNHGAGDHHRPNPPP